MQTSIELRPIAIGSTRNLLLLTGLFVLAAGVALSLQATQVTAYTTRWPADDDFYAAPGWTVSPASTEEANGNTYITRAYQSADGGLPITFTLTTSPSAKRVYRAGPDVPFLGSGYESVPAPAGPVSDTGNVGLTFLRRGNESWFQLYAYGERRGLVGNGPTGWSLAVFDTLVERPADYYLLRLLVPASNIDAPSRQRAVQLANTLFPRIAEWYGQEGS